MKIDLNSLRQDHPSFGKPVPAPNMSTSIQTADRAIYYGNFSSKTFNGNDLDGHIFADGNYTLPAQLKVAALVTAKFLYEKEKADIQKILPGLASRGGETSAEHVASHLLAMSVHTYRPYNLDRVLNPRKYGHPHDVESKFVNFFDTEAPLDQVGMAIARQFYGDNYDKSIGTTNLSDDSNFTQQMIDLLPPPRKGDWQVPLRKK